MRLRRRRADEELPGRAGVRGRFGPGHRSPSVGFMRAWSEVVGRVDHDAAPTKDMRIERLVEREADDSRAVGWLAAANRTSHLMSARGESRGQLRSEEATDRRDEDRHARVAASR